MSSLILLQLFVPLILGWVAMLLAPIMTRRELFFAVPVTAAFRESNGARTILRGYRLIVSAAAAAALIVGILVRSRLGPVTIAVSMLLYLTAAYIAFGWARHRALPHAVAETQVREASLSPQRETPWEGPFLELPPFFLVIVALGALLLHPPGPRSPALVLLLCHLPVLCMLLFARLGMQRARLGRVEGPGALEERRLRRRISRVVLGLEYAIAVFDAAPAFVPRTSLLRFDLTWLLLPVALVALLMVIVIRSRRRNPGAGGDGTDASRWRGGIFYVNADDPALLVEKRFGYGWTFNFGHPMAWVVLLLLLAPAVVGVTILALRQH